MMQRAANRVTNHQAVGQRAVVVRAVRTDSEKPVAAARQQDILVANATEQAAAVRE